jgi:hypothetical protein
MQYRIYSRIKTLAREKYPHQLRKLRFFLFRLQISRYRSFNFVPFDFNNPQPATAIHKLADLLRLATSRSLPLRPTDGTLLGLVRDRSLIAHDNDLDFDLPATPQNIRAIAKLAHDKEWTLCRHVIYRRKVQQLVYYDRDNQIFDFVFWEKIQSNYLNFGEKNYVRVQPAMFFDEYDSVTIGEITLDLPKNINGWLEHRYGPNWSIPDAQRPASFIPDCGDLIPRARL